MFTRADPDAEVEEGYWGREGADGQPGGGQDGANYSHRPGNIKKHNKSPKIQCILKPKSHQWLWKKIILRRFTAGPG